ncbi:MAG TPA: hypothetical protein VGB17_10630 [Pyrinomonadaceae bacterium]|jgi:flagellar basal body-associated protein FliL
MPGPTQKSSRGKRNRIVINIEGAKQKARGLRGGGSGGKVLGIIGILLLVIILSIVAGIYFWWQSYKTRPAYSLALIVDAAQRNDQATLDEMVDTNQVVENFVKQMTDRNGAGLLTGLSDPLRRQAQSVALRSLPQVRERVRQEVSNQIKELSTRAESKPFLLIALGMPFAVDIKQQDETASVKANLKERPVELTMQRNGERWKIVALKDDALAARIIENITKGQPAASQPTLPDVRKEIKKRLPPGVPDIPLLDNK